MRNAEKRQPTSSRRPCITVCDGATSIPSVRRAQGQKEGPGRAISLGHRRLCIDDAKPRHDRDRRGPIGQILGCSL